MSESYDNAWMLINAVRNALKEGTKHYDEGGNLLTTEREILEELVSGRKVELEFPKANA